MSLLHWPAEQADSQTTGFSWHHAGSNYCLDFHGDPAKAQLVVFSDGNHHMALQQTLQRFTELHPELNQIFYATTPPGVLVNLLRQGYLQMGNLRISVMPHVFISPRGILEQLQQLRHIESFKPFMRSNGNVLLVRHGNPKQIRSVTDLARNDVRLFLSHPQHETASFVVYAQTLVNFARKHGLNISDTTAESLQQHYRIVFGERIHHREAPQAIADDRADAALIYYHLALRYTRIFPDRFSIVSLDGHPEAFPQPSPNNALTTYFVGRVVDGGAWGDRLLAFLAHEEVAHIYKYHGLSRPD